MVSSTCDSIQSVARRTWPALEVQAMFLRRHEEYVGGVAPQQQHPREFGGAVELYRWSGG